MVQNPKRGGAVQKNEHVKSAFYRWILCHPKMFQSPRANDCIKITVDGQTTPKLVPKVLLQVSVRELNNSMVSPIEEGGLKEARDKDDNIIISDTNLRNILPPQVKKMTS